MKLIVAGFCLAVSVNLHGVPNPPVVTIEPNKVSVPSGTSMTQFTDSLASMSFHEVAAHGRFIPCSDSIPRFGISRGAHWLKFDVLNNTGQSNLQVAVAYPGIDELDIYLHRNDSTLLVAHSGLARDRQKGEPVFSDVAYSLPLRNGEYGTVYIRLSGFKHLHAPVHIGASIGMDRSLINKNLAIGVYMGVMVVLVLYNFFVFISIRDRQYFLYVLSTLFVCATQLTLQGHGLFDYVHLSGWFTARAGLILNLIAIPLGYEFARCFMNTAHFVPKMDKWVPLIYLAIGAILFTYLFVDPWVGQNLGNSISGISAIYLLVMAVVALSRGSRHSRFFLLSWTAFLVGVIIFVLKDEGVLPYSTLTVYAMPVGSAIEGILLSFGLADRINILRKEKELSQAQALASATENARIIRDQNVLLEQNVTERTHQLQQSLNDLKAAQSQLVEAEKMSSLGQLTAGIAHEINNPINFIRSNIAPLKRDLLEMLELLSAYRAQGASAEVAALEKRIGVEDTVREIREILHSMEEGANRTAEIVRGLRTFSRLDENDLKPVDLNEGLRNTLSILGPQMRDRVVVSLDLGTLERVECFPGQINQVLMNLLNNARQAVIKRHGDKGGRVGVVTRQVDEQVIISVTDNGTGMSDEVRARIFEPFFTTKDVGEGTGLGLSIAHSIIERHQGQIEVESSPGVGTTFKITLPNAQAVLIEKRA